MTLFIRRQPSTRVHFVGIGGIGMSGIAEVLLGMGCGVSGSDLKLGDTTKRLCELGAVIRQGHDASHLLLLGEDPDVVVTTSAVMRGNPEVEEARKKGIPVIRRAEMLSELMRLRYGIAVAGSHGKTTTTSLIATVLHAAGLDPTIVVGGRLPALGSNARLGQSEYLVAEADESDGSFLHLTPTVAVVTNIDPEHLDFYGDERALRAAFLAFLEKVPFFGWAVLCWDHEVLRNLARALNKRVVTYGLSEGAHFHARKLAFSGLTSSFVAYRQDTCLGPVELPLVGAHNVQNALAVLAVAEGLGIPFEVSAQALRTFSGVSRRFSVRGRVGQGEQEVLLVDDYGHHPTEIRATLRGAKAAFPSRRLLVAFQPHRYTRTRDLFADFSCAFADADLLLVTDIYAAGETPIPGVDARILVENIREQGHKGVRFVDKEELAQEMARGCKPGDVVITLGAGDISAVGPRFLAELAKVPGFQDAECKSVG